jgi:hypothetical protein
MQIDLQEPVIESMFDRKKIKSREKEMFIG